MTCDTNTFLNGASGMDMLTVRNFIHCYLTHERRIIHVIIDNNSKVIFIFVCYLGQSYACHYHMWCFRLMRDIYYHPSSCSFSLIVIVTLDWGCFCLLIYSCFTQSYNAAISIQYSSMYSMSTMGISSQWNNLFNVSSL